MSYFSIHNHSMYSNAKVKDSTNRPKEMIQYANHIGLKGIVLSDHEILSGHVKFINAYNELRSEKLKDGNVNPNPLPRHFKIGLGDEIYLCEEEDLEQLKENIANNNPDTRFYHFLLVALNKNGHQQLRQISTMAWENHFSSKGQDRTPTFKSTLKSIVKKGDIVASTACIGGIVGHSILKLKQAEEEGNIDDYEYYDNRLRNFLEFCIDVFGKEHFYLEMQPSENEEQIYVNKHLLQLSKETGIKYIVATDGHYLKKEDRNSHRIYLQSDNKDREVDAFYSSTYIMSEEEVREYMITHLTNDEIDIALANTMEIYEKVEQYDLFHKTIIPTPKDTDIVLEHILEPIYDKYEYIKKFAYSDFKVDQHYLQRVQEGLVEQIVRGRKADKEYFHKCLERINLEMKELWLISDRLQDRMSKYYLLTKEVVDLIWTKGDSLTGVSRGSAGGYLTVALLGITQLNSLDYNLPHYRHLTSERPELPDIDLDSEKSKRSKIIEALRMKYKPDHVLNIATFSTEGSRSALLSAARGMGIDIDEVSYLTSLIPVERGFSWTLSDCFKGNTKKGRKVVKELYNAVSKHEGLMEAALSIEGLIKGRSQHASGVYLYDSPYYVHNAAMKTSSGLIISQFDMKDSDYMGGLKLDLLTVEGIDKIRICMDLLIEHGYMEWQGSLRKTYNKFLHPDVLDYDTVEMWEKVAQNKVADLFQFDTSVGLQCAKKSKPMSIVELTAANNLMRLMSDGEQPIDKYVRFKENPEDWIQEMREYGLTEEEMEIVKKHLGKSYGVSSSQEEMMELLMDENIGRFTIPEANKARKVVGKKLMDEIPEVKDLLFTKGLS